MNGVDWKEEATTAEANDTLVNAIKFSSYVIPQTTGFYNPKYNKPWWNVECSRLTALRKRAKCVFCKNQTDENLRLLREAENAAKHYHNKLKKECWQTHASTLT